MIFQIGLDLDFFLFRSKSPIQTENSICFIRLNCEQRRGVNPFRPYDFPTAARKSSTHAYVFYSFFVTLTVKLEVIGRYVLVVERPWQRSSLQQPFVLHDHTIRRQGAVHGEHTTVTVDYI